MPPPSSFIIIDTIPFSRVVTQAEFNVANEIWFKYVAAVPIVLGLQTNSGGTFVPRTIIYESDGTTQRVNFGQEINGLWHALSIVGDYYIKIDKFPVAPSNFDFTFTADTKPLNSFTLVTGDIVVNDDEDNHAAALLSSTGAVKAFISAIPGGEMGAILPSNVSYWHDKFGRYNPVHGVAVFNSNLIFSNLALIGLTSIDPAYFAIDITNNKVYVYHQEGQLWTISNVGIATNTGYTFPGPDFPQVIAVNENGTKLYWADKDNNGIIHVLNLSTFTVLSDLYTVPAWNSSTDVFATTPNDHPGDMFVMPNGNIVTWWRRTTPAYVYHLIVVNSAGILLYEYTYTQPIQLNHLAYIHGDSDHILIWLFTNNGLSIARFGRLALSTGVIDQDFITDTFSTGENQVGPIKFGPSASCTFVRLRVSNGNGNGNGDEEVPLPSGADIGGIYFINDIEGRKDIYYNSTGIQPPDIPGGETGSGGTTTSIYRKIPNPTIRTALLGD